MHPRVYEDSGAGLMRSWPAQLKLALALGIIVFTTLLPIQPKTFYAVSALVLFAGWAGAGMPLKYTVRRLVFAQGFIVGIALFSLFSSEPSPRFLAAYLKSNLCVLTLILLTWTTPFTEILAELRRARIPALMLTTLALMFRYLPVLTAETRRMQRARASRTFSNDRFLHWQNLSAVISQLFVRSAARAERIYQAMCARGWK